MNNVVKRNLVVAISLFLLAAPQLLLTKIGFFGVVLAILFGYFMALPLFLSTQRHPVAVPVIFVLVCIILWTPILHDSLHGQFKSSLNERIAQFWYFFSFSLIPNLYLAGMLLTRMGMQMTATLFRFLISHVKRN